MRVEKPLTKPASSKARQTRTFTPSRSRQKKPLSAKLSSVIISIGTDIVEVERIRETLKRTPRFLERVFTEAERNYCLGKGNASDQHFAARFSAKEALMKALGTGWRGKISWHDIEISNDENGAPSILLTGEARQIFDALKATRIHVSLSHTHEHATATVILEN